MKRITLLLLALITGFISCNSDLQDEIDTLRNEIDSQKKILSALQNDLKITSISNKDDGYIINFSDNTSINISEGKTPMIDIGSNGNWFINEEDTGINALGEDGITPSIFIGSNGNWFINNEDTGIRATPEDGQNAPTIQSIVQTLDSFIFNFSDNTSISAPISSKLKAIALWGDSLTTVGNYYPNKLQDLTGESYKVINRGVGGENTVTIGARQGGLSMFIKNGFTFPSSTEPIILGDLEDIPFVSSYNESVKVRPLIQGGNGSINSAIVDNVECIIKYTGTSWNDLTGKYTIERTTAGEVHEVKANATVYTSSMRNLRNLHANVFFMGQNGGFTSPEDLVNQYKKMIQFSGSPNYLVIGLHKAGSVSRMKVIEKALQEEFGVQFINLREYLVTDALRDACLQPTTEDLLAIQNGECPPQLLADKIHFTKTGFELLAKIVNDRMLNLGMVDH